MPTGQNKSQLRQALQRIRHKSGTTKTGKALEKAIQLYKDKSSGARFGNVAKVVVVVSDGRSLDDPVPTAIRLRQTGVFLISLGIGTHVNLAELLQMSGDSEMVFDEQTENKSVERFTDLFKRLSTAEACEFVRGGNGADIRCGSSVIEVLTTTKTKFRGLFYVQGHWLEPECIGMNDENEGNGTELVLRIPLGKCGLEKQFSTNPKGYFFRGTAILQFHPNFRTGTDKIWKILCFYRDHSSNEPGRGEDSEIEWQLIRDHTQRKDRRPTQMPCSYRLLAAEHMEQMSRPPWGNNAATGAAECLTRTIPLILGQNVIHSWECNSDHFDVYQSFLINSCFLEPSKNNEISTQMLIDKNGCSTEPTLIETPQYVNQLKAFARGVAIRGIGNETSLRLRCSLKFCDRLMGECEEILPPKCGKEDFKITTTQINSTKEEEEENKNNNENNNTVINKRRRRKQSGFPVLIRPLNGDGPAPPLVMFTKSSSKRRRPTQIDKRNFIVKDELIKNEKEKIVKSFETTVKTTLLENKKRNSIETTIETTTTTTKPLITTNSLSTSFDELIKDSKSNIQELTTTFPPPPQLIEEDSIITKQTKNENKKFNYKRNEIISTEEVTGKADPFQEENDIVQNEGNLIKEVKGKRK
uniref:VWFA domain-containing protein n=1 Tax=Meloidogyne incognita TaxID=6306 RepID=A0A914LN45_MELIC